MFDIPDFVLLIVVFDVIVVLVIAGYIIRRRRKNNKHIFKVKKSEVEEESQIPVSLEGKTLHRCPNPKCNKLIVNPAKEIVYVTEPPTERLICPYCQVPLVTMQKGELKIGKTEFEFEPTIQPKIFKYDLVTNPKFYEELTATLTERGFKLNPFIKGNEIHIIFASEKELSFEKLKQAGKIVKWSVVE
jgi:hypothetical protein